MSRTEGVDSVQVGSGPAGRIEAGTRARGLRWLVAQVTAVVLATLVTATFVGRAEAFVYWTEGRSRTGPTSSAPRHGFVGLVERPERFSTSKLRHRTKLGAGRRFAGASGVQFGEPALQESTLRSLPDEGRRTFVRCSCRRNVAQPPAHVRAGRMREVVVGEVAARENGVNRHESCCRAVPHRDGNGTVQLDDG